MIWGSSVALSKDDNSGAGAEKADAMSGVSLNEELMSMSAPEGGVSSDADGTNEGWEEKAHLYHISLGRHPR